MIRNGRCPGWEPRHLFLAAVAPAMTGEGSNPPVSGERQNTRRVPHFHPQKYAPGRATRRKRAPERGRLPIGPHMTGRLNPTAPGDHAKGGKRSMQSQSRLIRGGGRRGHSQIKRPLRDSRSRVDVSRVPFRSAPAAATAEGGHSGWRSVGKMDDATLDRFRKICGLLGSSHEGERSAAALKASKLLAAAGQTWAAVSIGGASAAGGPRWQELAAEAAGQAALWERLCRDERLRTTVLSGQLRDAKKELDKLRAELATRPVQEQPKQKRRRREPMPEPELTVRGPNEERTLRWRIREVLESDRIIPARTRDFLESLSKQSAWTDKQRDALERTLRWVFNG